MLVRKSPRVLIPHGSFRPVPEGSVYVLRRVRYEHPAEAYHKQRHQENQNQHKKPSSHNYIRLSGIMLPKQNCQNTC